MGDLMAARMKAVSQHRKVKLFFADTSAYTICDDADSNGTVDHGEGAALVKDLSTTYAGVRVSATLDPIFHPTGSAANRPTITITNAHGTKSITVAITGDVKIN
jgi:Type II transport protein GspH